MRQTDYTINQTKRKIQRYANRLRLGIIVREDIAVLLRLRTKGDKCRQDLQRLEARKRHIKTINFNLNSFSSEACLKNFRFLPTEIQKVAEIMDFYGSTSRSSYACDKLTACCIVLRRLAAPCRWLDLEPIFGMRLSVLSEVFWEAVTHFVDNWGHVLTSFRADLMTERVESYASSIREHGGILPNCVGFIDCTKIEMSRPGGPGVNQRACYSGHKRFHCLIYQTITTPDGLIFHMHGPEMGRRHDLTLYRQSGMDNVLEQSLHVEGQQYYIYGDPAYILRPWLQVAFSRTFATPEQLLVNKTMSAVRVSVEHSYKDMKQMWSSQDFKRMLKVRDAPISIMYKASALLWNFKVCLQHGGQVQTAFEVDPPTIDRYLQTNVAQ